MSGKGGAGPYARAAARLHVAGRCLGLLLVLTGASLAQPVEPSIVAAHTRARLDGEADHLMRVGAWGGTNLVGGFLAATMSDSNMWSSFGVQSAGWGAVNLGIVAIALTQRASSTPTTFEEERAEERRYQRALRINLALNGGYVLVGGLTTLSAEAGPDGARQRGHGVAIVTQGAALLLLDGLAYHDSRRRTTTLRQVAVRPGPMGAHVAVRL